jgi:hypothetical protein
MESGKVDGGGLVVSSGQAAPLLELVDAPLDGVAPFVCLAVEGRRPAAATAEAFAVGGLVGWLRDHRPDSALAQVVADRAVRVCLVGQDHLRRGPGPAGPPGHP